MTSRWKTKTLTRRDWLGGAALTAGLGLAVLAAGLVAAPTTASVGTPQPEEKIADTIKRLFGDRKLGDGSQLLKLEAPFIAENGSVVPVSVAATQANTREKHIKTIYVLVDQNRRPMSATFSFTPEAGKPFIGTNLRLGNTSAVRAVAEFSDGSLVQVMREVKVTVGGCGG
ncbi:MAG: thiosulfate oxidation carrier protein SoxY [Pseudomonadota bacterium]